ncbi:hypothetical protein SS50377_28252 [Spironucleus salmonicida]|uniref:Uncharacterized protein n=1 Tax=Spironucleus salmonicida TaxID=348837 RepID=V6LXI6_9EUKA|nr:hypothetical protein SS50377_28252 [Spironucleus salmonicida]|eukprot:EST48431.1 Hypothetical protein SS50377_11381 [Spironucleus salmonicida]
MYNKPRDTLRNDPYYLNLVTNKQLYEQDGDIQQSTICTAQISKPENNKQVQQLVNNYKKEMIYLQGGIQALKEYENCQLQQQQNRVVQFQNNQIMQQSVIKTPKVQFQIDDELKQSVISTTNVQSYMAHTESTYSQNQVESVEDLRPSLEELDFFKETCSIKEEGVYQQNLDDIDYTSLTQTKTQPDSDEMYGNESPPTPPAFDQKMRPSCNFEVPVTKNSQRTICQTGSFFQSKSAQTKSRTNPDELTLEDFEDELQPIQQTFSDCLIQDNMEDNLFQSVVRSNQVNTNFEIQQPVIHSTQLNSNPQIMQSSFNPLRSAVLNSLGVSQAKQEISKVQKTIYSPLHIRQSQPVVTIQRQKSLSHSTYLKKIKQESEQMRHKKYLEMQRLLEK